MTNSETIGAPLPHYAVILTVVPGDDLDGYREMCQHLVAKAKTHPGFLGIEMAESDIGIVVSYWESIDAIRIWSADSFHQAAKHEAKQRWYKSFRTRICKVELNY
ncbi:heme-degrading monooxygenase HmoA [Alicyclobacillus sacchari]|uniref:Heme-degrading monooxygenase HmoA n=1 Tax=Alicyclobacillus sacchari TaxID=392010 RepID=A0A4R8LXC1_9BACL|nr:antibiotic biosynthesis monooxygenase [Alicyclobacillus sacchari]TDY51346.1 heme-degrading monooxygenase HmoA [Alicyclobacillus sacchari]GMA56660.1 antibiotic biosynthesis monooxygenase [Alicyclobacillus sacchari]